MGYNVEYITAGYIPQLTVIGIGNLTVALEMTLLPDPGTGQEGYDHRSGRIGQEPPGPDYGVNVTGRLPLLLIPSSEETLVFRAHQRLASLVAPPRRDDLEPSHGATTNDRENDVKQDRVRATNAIASP